MLKLKGFFIDKLAWEVQFQKCQFQLLLLEYTNAKTEVPGNVQIRIQRGDQTDSSQQYKIKENGKKVRLTDEFIGVSKMIQHTKKKNWDAKYCEFILVQIDNEGQEEIMKAVKYDMTKHIETSRQMQEKIIDLGRGVKLTMRLKLTASHKLVDGELFEQEKSEDLNENPFPEDPKPVSARGTGEESKQEEELDPQAAMEKKVADQEKQIKEQQKVIDQLMKAKMQSQIEMSEIIEENLTAVEKSRDLEVTIKELEEKMKGLQYENEAVVKQKEEHQCTAESLAEELDTHKEEIQNKEIALEHIKSVRDKVVEDLDIQVQMYKETNAEKLKSDIADHVNDIETNLKPQIEELPRWKLQVDFLLNQLNSQVSLKESCEQQLSRERREVKKLQQNLKYIEDQYAMKKMQDKTKAKGTGLRATMERSMKDSVKRDSVRKPAGAGARPSIVVSDVNK